MRPNTNINALEVIETMERNLNDARANLKLAEGALISFKAYVREAEK